MIEKSSDEMWSLFRAFCVEAIRGNVVTSAFAAGKFGLRALSQSLAKEFGKQNIHVSPRNASSFTLVTLTFRLCAQVAHVSRKRSIF